eukprot:Amastigsp_a178004_8.p5 type:complete len:114 gc:universal Amastigsp_a178004_8:1016-675(-)
MSASRLEPLGPSRSICARTWMSCGFDRGATSPRVPGVWLRHGAQNPTRRTATRAPRVGPSAPRSELAPIQRADGSPPRRTSAPPLCHWCSPHRCRRPRAHLPRLCLRVSSCLL